ncbi:STE/STE11/BCK1 protein [Salix suchowensis]|nr:STE/STE11/BCK1 protein [Salix suchowensis]
MKALLVPLICDMLGARQVAGLPGTVNAHYFCTTCDLDVDDIDILDIKEWIMREHNTCGVSQSCGNPQALKIIETSIEQNRADEISQRAGITVPVFETICQLLDIDPTDIKEVTMKMLLAQGLRGESADEATNLNIKAIRLAAKAIISCGADDDKWDGLHRARGVTATGLEACCRLLNIETSELAPRTRKAMLAEVIVRKIAADDTAFATLKMHIQNMNTNESQRQRQHRRIVLGKDVMQEIWTDMHNTQLPSWVCSVSREWSTTSELSADQTRVLCTIHLPITLVRLWHNANDRMKALLANFMDLINAVRVANMRTTSPGDVESYTTYMHRYMVEAQKLYKDEGIKPHQHAALHVGTMLEWKPSKTSMIRLFMTLNNVVIGDMEVSFMLASARSANMRALLANEDEHGNITEMMHRLTTLAGEPARGYHRVDDFDAAHGFGVTIGEAEYTLGSRLAGDVSVEDGYQAPLSELLSGAVDFDHALFYDDVYVGGIPYGRTGSSKWRNSSVMFRPTPSAEPQAGQIDHIAQFYSEPGVFLAIRSFTPWKLPQIPTNVMDRGRVSLHFVSSISRCHRVWACFSLCDHEDGERR